MLKFWTWTWTNFTYQCVGYHSSLREMKKYCRVIVGWAENYLNNHSFLKINELNRLNGRKIILVKHKYYKFSQ